jgi:nucleotide-binding universal stress UspA family protein
MTTGQNPNQTVLVAVNRSAACACAVRWAASEAARRGARLHAIHVTDPSGRHDTRLERDHRLALDHARRTLPSRVADWLARAGHDLDLTVTVASGGVAERLALAAEGAALLVVGAPDGAGHRGLPQTLAEHCTCPVAVVSQDGGVAYVETPRPDTSSPSPEGASDVRA